MVFLDTHVLVWLYFNTLEKLSEKAITTIEKNDLAISPIVILEVEYLYEIKRISVSSNKIIEQLQDDLNLLVDQQSFSGVIDKALSENWTRDVFDRTIVAQATINQSFLISADKNIQKNYTHCIW